jgi:DNA modification methylase
MGLFLDDGDVCLYQGDVRDVLAGMPDGSVDCVVTSPPYWGLRDYGTGAWQGGEEGCNHAQPAIPHTGLAAAAESSDGKPRTTSGTRAAKADRPYTQMCGKCGATRVDQQLGLEATPDEFVANMVAVFREVRRVLAAHGTCWVNLGDSYASQGDRKHGGWNGDSYYTHGPQRIKGDAMGAPMDLASSGLKVKDLVGAPWRVAFALQADGWYLRSDIVWSKPNPMPESVTDRPTKSHEYVFLLAKQPRYFFDQEAVREDYIPDGRVKRVHDHAVTGGHENYSGMSGGRERWAHAGRNVRSVWTIPTQPYPEAHFATYPEELVRRCVLAGCPQRVCRVCGAPSERIVEASEDERRPYVTVGTGPKADMVRGDGSNRPQKVLREDGRGGDLATKQRETTGWSDCGHNDWRPGLVLDPFVGSGTTCKVARDHGRHSIGIDLSVEYLELAARRLQQLSLLT